MLTFPEISISCFGALFYREEKKKGRDRNIRVDILIKIQSTNTQGGKYLFIAIVKRFIFFWDKNSWIIFS